MKKMIEVYCDGGSRGNPGPSACAFSIKDDGRIISQGQEFLGQMTNNEAEYFGVIKAFQYLLKNYNLLSETETVNFYLDSRLVVNQLKGLFKIKNSRLRELITQIKILEVQLKKNIYYFYIPREKNQTADLLVNQTLDMKNSERFF